MKENPNQPVTYNGVEYRGVELHSDEKTFSCTKECYVNGKKIDKATRGSIRANGNLDGEFVVNSKVCNGQNMVIDENGDVTKYDSLVTDKASMETGEDYQETGLEGYTIGKVLVYDDGKLKIYDAEDIRVTGDSIYVGMGGTVQDTQNERDALTSDVLGGGTSYIAPVKKKVGADKLQ